jgi:hypothetical protein
MRPLARAETKLRPSFVADADVARLNKEFDTVKRLLMSAAAALAMTGALFTSPAKAATPMPWGFSTFRYMCTTLNDMWAKNGTQIVCNPESDGLLLLGAHTLYSTADLQHRCGVMVNMLSEYIAPGPMKIEFQTAEDDVICHR